MQNEKIAVLIPCFNEEATIRKVVLDYKSVIPNACIYVYDNNSSDNTIVEAQSAGAIVVNEYRQGKGNVIRSMFRNIEADCYIVTDGDDTYPAEAAKEMVELILSKKADMVIGDRLSATYFTENKRLFHSFGNKLVRELINTLFKSQVKDIMSGYRAFNKLFVKSFPILSKGFEIETEMIIHALDKNYLIKEIQVQYRDRPSGSFSKLNTYSDGIKVLKTIFVLFKEYKPLSFFALCAAILMLFSMLLFLPILFEFFNTGVVPKIPTLIVSGFIALCSILSLFCGIILDVIVKKHRQLYELYLTGMFSNDKK